MSIGIGVIGTGVMGAEHARILRHETPGAHLAGIFDTDAIRAQAVASGAIVFSDPQSLIASDRIDAIVIASPDATHAALTLACIEAGKPVLCEKPLASSAADALDVVQAEVALGRRLIQVGYMRRFDHGYQEIKRVKDTGELGGPVLLHNVHRNVRAPEWFNGSMAITNSFVHEIDCSRWLLGSEMVSAHVETGPGGEPLMITLKSDKNEIVSTEVFVNASYGYHVHVELVGRQGTISLAPASLTLLNRDRSGGHSYPDNWVPRFKEAYRRQMADWVSTVKAETSVGASAWDGYVASAIAEQVVEALAGNGMATLKYGPRPPLYD
ncbi:MULTISPECIES: Gfo/Idh/MocA family oxidoreductase [unclassified Bradyrhizobium]|uniref:Gfo/Idh/MocA family protein n=1 Tax=unclassified Bradyrhizobium TaxID=2631580 RepID=UPI001FFB4E9B|nr:MULTISPECIES: Gfo/Idh/MocA family oxidoreductase [unclassified Bradyrhizobium]MCK1713335.1 Gfo/Idh/MocA family oxidoreductase [Bradyrhizobium sp. 143]MCK1730380.1 Gfo/Idh/MocA family oxidoreductase [Bradyrhizobium sp. 142]